MHQQKFFKIPGEPLIHSTKFVDQIINSHIAITGDLCHLIAVAFSHLNIIIPSLPLPLWLFPIIIIIFPSLDNPFSFLGNTFSFCPMQETPIPPNCIMTRHPSCHLCCIVSLVACSKGYLRKVYMKMLWTLCIVAIKGPMGVNCRDVVDNGVEFRYVEMLAYAKFLEYLLVFMYC